MVVTKSIAGVIPGVMSLSLLGHSMQMIPKEFGGKADSKKGTANFLKGFTGVMVGIPMIKSVSTSVAAL